MNQQHRQAFLPDRIQSLAPEHLLLLTIFGNNKLKRRIDAELDRRAQRLLPRLGVCPRRPELLPAA